MREYKCFWNEPKMPNLPSSGLGNSNKASIFYPVTSAQTINHENHYTGYCDFFVWLRLYLIITIVYSAQCDNICCSSVYPTRSHGKLWHKRVRGVEVMEGPWKPHKKKQTYPKVLINPLVEPSAYREQMSPIWRKLDILSVMIPQLWLHLQMINMTDI